jgi:hypothetical protein
MIRGVRPVRVGMARVSPPGSARPGQPARVSPAGVCPGRVSLAAGQAVVAG